MNSTTKRWLLFLAVAAVVFIIANAINILLVNREPEIPATTFIQTNVDNSQSSFSEVTYSGSSIEIPTELPVASAQRFTTSEDDVLALIVEQFNVTPHPNVPNLWTNDSWALSESRNGLFTLVKNNFQIIENPELDINQTTNVAQNFVNNYFQQLNITLINSSIRYYNNVFEPREIDASPNAAMVKIPFSYTIAGYPVFYEQNALFPFEVWVTAENEVSKFTYYPQFVQLQEVGTKPLISIDQAIENINQNNLASVISYNNTSTTIITLEEVTSADLTSVSLEYRVDSSTNVAFPFYRFAGTALLSGIETPIEITTPAVEVTQ
jgi:hypothetical protein